MSNRSWEKNGDSTNTSWKSGNRAEVEFVLRSPLTGIDVKSTFGDLKSLNSFALLEPEATCLVKIGRDRFAWNEDHVAKLPNVEGSRKILLLEIPHYLVSRLTEFLQV